jgi:putative ABC transport system permease protein
MWRARWIVMRLVHTLLPSRADRDLAREVDAHLAAAEDEYTRRGLTASEARLAARRLVGGLDQIREQHRDARSFRWLDDARRDVRYAARMLRRTPGFTAIAIASLAIGIGANAVLFSLVDGLVLRALAVPRPGEIVAVRELWPGSRPRLEVPTWEYAGLRDGAAGVLSLAAYNVFDRSNIAVAGPSASAAADAGRARVGIVSGNYFETMQLGARVGRALTPDDDRAPLASAVAVISDEYWTRRLRRTPDVLLHSLVLNQTSFAIVGVMPAGFTGVWVGRPVDVWVPMTMQARVMVEAPDALSQSNAYWLRLIGRLRPGVTGARAEAVLQPLYQQVMRDAAARFPGGPGPAVLARQRLELVPGGRGFSAERDSLAGSVRTLTLVAVLVLLIVCANLAGLLVSRSAARHREFAVRLALGAAGSRLARQLLTEALLLSVFGGALGLLAAVWGTRALGGLLATAPIQMFWASSSWIAFDVRLGVRGLAFTAVVSLATGLLFGLAPLFRGTVPTLAPALSGRSAIDGSGGRRVGLAQALVALQVAASLVMIVSAALLVRTLFTLRTQDLGFNRDRLLLVWTQPSSTGRRGPELAALWRDVQAGLAAVPGVESASGANSPILGGLVPAPGRLAVQMRVEGQQPRPTSAPGSRTFVQPGFFRTLGVPMLIGREFTEADTTSTSRVVVIGEAMARFYFGRENPIGRHIGFISEPGTPLEIVGVVRDFERGTPRAAGREQMLTYFPYRADTAGPLVILCGVVRTHGDPLRLAAPIREALRAVDPSLAVLHIDTVDQQLDDVLARERLSAGTAAFFGGVAALLACLGLYGLVSHMTARRTTEIGVRIALGATSGRVLAMVLREGVYMVAAGLVIGVPATLAVTRILAPQLFQVSPRDPLTIGLASLVLVTIAVAAAALPARRASRVDPMVALRQG